MKNQSSHFRGHIQSTIDLCLRLVWICEQDFSAHGRTDERTFRPFKWSGYGPIGPGGACCSDVRVRGLATSGLAWGGGGIVATTTLAMRTTVPLLAISCQVAQLRRPCRTHQQQQQGKKVLAGSDGCWLLTEAPKDVRAELVTKKSSVRYMLFKYSDKPVLTNKFTWSLLLLHICYECWRKPGDALFVAQIYYHKACFKITKFRKMIVLWLIWPNFGFGAKILTLVQANQNWYSYLKSEPDKVQIPTLLTTPVYEERSRKQQLTEQQKRKTERSRRRKISAIQTLTLKSYRIFLCASNSILSPTSLSIDDCILCCMQLENGKKKCNWVELKYRWSRLSARVESIRSPC